MENEFMQDIYESSIERYCRSFVEPERIALLDLPDFYRRDIQIIKIGDSDAKIRKLVTIVYGLGGQMDVISTDWKREEIKTG